MPHPQTGSGARLLGLFGAVTSAMQPARFPAALLGVLFIVAIVPLVDLAAGKSYGPRGFAGATMGESEREIAYERARSATRRIAGDDLAALEERPSLGELASAVRSATARASVDVGPDEARRLRERAVDAIEVIESARMRGVATVFLEGERSAFRQTVDGLFNLDPEAFLAGVLGAVFTIPAAAIREAPLVVPLGLVVALSVVALLAGALGRMAAVHAGRGERLGALEGAGFARARVLNLVSLPVLPVIVLGVLGLLVAVFAVMLRVPVLNVVAAALLVVPLLVALFASILALVAIAAFPLMPAAVAVEDCDAGDAITRAGALVLSRPMLWLGTLAAAITVLVAGGALVNGVLAFASWSVSTLLESLGGEAGRALASGDVHEIGALFGPDRLVGVVGFFWTELFEALGAAYVFSLACDLAARSYLLMRERIDGEDASTIAGYGIR
ncbi:MAG: hypothetical protein LW636_09390 [Planctomycetaceae bacterium]|nr:hypothetical protein [Planctomycetaceae bacterium]